MAGGTKVPTPHFPLDPAEQAAWMDREKRHRMTLNALADVDAGRVIDHQAIRAWADSLGTERPLPLPAR